MRIVSVVRGTHDAETGSEAIEKYSMDIGSKDNTNSIQLTSIKNIFKRFRKIELVSDNCILIRSLFQFSTTATLKTRRQLSISVGCIVHKWAAVMEVSCNNTAGSSY